MANRVRQTHSFRGRGSRRATEWGIFSGSTGFASLAASTKAVAASFSSTDLSELIPGTIVRTRGVLSIQTDQFVASEQQFGALGCALVNDVAQALGITALPGPFTNQNYDWFLLQFFVQSNIFGTGVGFIEQGASRQFEIDSKAMRKLGNGDSLVIMLENASAAHAFDFAVMLRFLVKMG